MNDLSSIVVLLLSVFGSVFLGITVFRKNPRHASHIAFSVMNGVFLLWSIVMFLSIRMQDPDIAIWVIRSTIFLVMILLSSVFVFVSIFPSSSFSLSRKFVVALSSITGAGMILALSPWVFTNVEYINGLPHTVSGIGMILYAPLTFILIIGSITRLVQKYKKADEALKELLRPILIGFTLMFFLQMSFNFFAPVFFDNVAFIAYGPLFVLIFQCFAAFAILRYRFLDIRVLFRKNFIVGMSVLFATLIYSWSLYYLESTTPLPSSIAWIVGPILLLVGYEAIKRIVRVLLDRYFFTDVFDPSNQLDFEKRFQNVQGELNEWFAEVSKKIFNALGDQEIKLFLVDRVNHDLIQFSPRGKARFSENHEGVQFVAGLSEPVLLSALLEQEHWGQALKGFLSTLKRRGKVVVPLAYQGRFLGFFLLRSKEAGRMYSLADLRFLSELSLSFTHPLNESITYFEALHNFSASSHFVGAPR